MSKFIQNRRGWFIGLIVIMTFGLIVGLSSCAAGAKSLSDLNAELNGTTGTMRTYDQNSGLVDEIHGKSFAFSRDAKFDTMTRKAAPTPTPPSWPSAWETK